MSLDFLDNNKSTDTPPAEDGAAAVKAAGNGTKMDDAPIRSLEGSDSHFVDLMTFTSVKPTCDCDECCIVSVRSSAHPSQVPETFYSVLKGYKRRKLAEMPLRRSQVRTLLGRSGSDSVAVWQWIMPLSAEPLVEFGNPLIHRIIWIQRLHRRLILKHIGTGILGSREEEQGRKQLDWIEDDIILVSGEGTRSTGYVVENVGDEYRPDADEVVGPAVLYVAKVQLQTESIANRVESQDDAGARSAQAPFDVIRSVCIRSILSRSDIEDEQNAFKIDDTNKQLFRQIILNLVNEAKITI
jgi:hypothetical protein